MLVTNSSALIVPARPSGTNGAAGPIFHEAPKPLIYIPNGWAWVVWTAVILALLAALYFAWRWWRKKPSVVIPPVPAHVRARRRLEQALAKISEPKLFSFLFPGRSASIWRSVSTSTRRSGRPMSSSSNCKAASCSRASKKQPGRIPRQLRPD